MSTTKEINLGQFNIASTDRFRAIIKKDGAVWDLSNGTVEIVLESPDRTTTVTEEMTAEDAANGIFFWDSAVTDFLLEGGWTANVRITDGAIVKRYPYEIFLKMVDHP